MASRFLEERQQQILELIKDNGRISVKDLSKYFKTSTVTIRNDLNTLEKLGRITRTHGGAIANDLKRREIEVENETEADILRKIGREASNLIHDGEVIYLGVGSTCAGLFPFLSDKKNLTVITPNIEAAYWLMKSSDINVFLLGGTIDKESSSTIGFYEAETARRWNISKAIVSSFGFTLEQGLMYPKTDMIESSKLLWRRAQSVIALLDSSKWGRVAMYTGLQSEELNIVITDDNAPPGMISGLEKMSVRVIKV